jgi:hypothetical protein
MSIYAGRRAIISLLVFIWILICGAVLMTTGQSPSPRVPNLTLLAEHQQVTDRHSTTTDCDTYQHQYAPGAKFRRSSSLAHYL